MKGNKKTLTFLLAFLTFFGLFLFILLRPSTQSKAIKEINTCISIEDVKDSWNKYRLDLSDNTDFCQAARNKLQSFGLKQNEIVEIKKWLPSKTNNLNIIIVSDLSHRRLVDDTNKPTSQVNDDKFLISKIWDEFQSKVRLKQNPKDRFFIDVIDDGQADEFRSIADSLVVDLKTYQNKPIREILKKESLKIKNNLDNLYSLALKSTSGADFGDFFDQKLPHSKRVMKSNLDDNYRNILIIFSDGIYETGKYPHGKREEHFKKYLEDKLTINIPTPQSEGFKNLEAYIFEINPLIHGESSSIISWWENWFVKLNFANIEDKPVHIHEPTRQLTLDAIHEIFSASQNNVSGYSQVK